MRVRTYIFPGVLRGLPEPRLATIPASRPCRSLSSPGTYLQAPSLAWPFARKAMRTAPGAKKRRGPGPLEDPLDLARRPDFAGGAASHLDGLALGGSVPRLDSTYPRARAIATEPSAAPRSFGKKPRGAAADLDRSPLRGSREVLGAPFGVTAGGPGAARVVGPNSALPWTAKPDGGMAIPGMRTPTTARANRSRHGRQRFSAGSQASRRTRPCSTSAAAPGEGNIARVREVNEAAARATAPELVGRSPWTFAGPRETHRRPQESGFTEIRCWSQERPTRPKDLDAFAHFDSPCEPRAAFTGATGAFRRRGRARARLPLDYVRLNVSAVRAAA